MTDSLPSREDVAKAREDVKRLFLRYRDCASGSIEMGDRDEILDSMLLALVSSQRADAIEAAAVVIREALAHKYPTTGERIGFVLHVSADLVARMEAIK